MFANVQNLHIKQKTKSGSVVLGIFAVAFVLMFLSSALIYLPAYLLGITIGVEGFRAQLASVISLQLLALPIATAIYIKLTDKPLSFLNIEPPNKNDIKLIIAGVFGILALGYILSFIFMATNVEMAESTLVTGSTPTQLLVFAILSILVIGPAEELFFRGVIQEHLRDSFSTYPAILIASVIFALPHYTALLAGEGQWVSIAVIFMLGAVLGWMYEQRQNIVVIGLIHGFYNAFVFLVQLLAIVV